LLSDLKGKSHAQVVDMVDDFICDAWVHSDAKVVRKTPPEWRDTVK
jgi:hypothetical protein